MKQFEEKGFTFGANPTQFKIVSEGTYNRANYTLIALVVLPGSSPAQNNAQICPEGQTGTPPNCRPMTDEEKEKAKENTTTTTATNSPTQLLEPRILEIQIN